MNKNESWTFLHELIAEARWLRAHRDTPWEKKALDDAVEELHRILAEQETLLAHANPKSKGGE